MSICPDSTSASRAISQVPLCIAMTVSFPPSKSATVGFVSTPSPAGKNTPAQYVLESASSVLVGTSGRIEPTEPPLVEPASMKVGVAPAVAHSNRIGLQGGCPSAICSTAHSAVTPTRRIEAALMLSVVLSASLAVGLRKSTRETITIADAMKSATHHFMKW
jgi:hypothetical protein